MSDALLTLASASPRRLQLLAQVGVVPAAVLPADIDESPHAGELPRAMAARLAREKALAAHQDGRLTLGADTVVAAGRRALPKAEEPETARRCLRLLSGRSHQVISAVALVKRPDQIGERVSVTRVTFKRLTAAEIDGYVSSGEWEGKAGGYAIQGRAARFVVQLNGSYSGVVGLPLHETCALLVGAGYRLP
jgi:septum formation protein